MIEKILQERNLPSIIPTEKMKQILLENEYGQIPDIEYKMSVSEPVIVEKRYCASKAIHSYVNMTISTEYGSHSFQVNRLIYNDGEVRPFFVLLNFYSDVPNKYYPAEEVAEEGFNVLSVCYKDITSDDGDFTNGLAKILLPNGQETEETCGKIMIWAWAAMRIMDYAQTIPSLDINQSAVVGHSRLGKTALLTAMIDERFKYAFSNDSGCSGASVARGGLGVLGKKGSYTTGETISVITTAFPYWFCKKYKSYAEKNIPDNFDQHYLLASIAPRFVYVASASMDDWADPDSEFISCVAASKQYEKLGYKGLCHNNKLPQDGEVFHEGRIGYHKRFGEHFLSRHDWHEYMKYIKKHKND